MTSAIRLFTSNRLELLVDQLAGLLQAPLDDPLDQEVIVVQSRGMEKWLAMQLSERLGSWGNCRYPFPNALAWEMFRLAFPALSEESAYAPETMIWSLMDIIPRSLEKPGFEKLGSYLSDARQGVKLFQLAGAVADLFDQYTLFRPEMLSAWERGRSCDNCRWQADLWRTLAGNTVSLHRGRLLRDFHAIISGRNQLTGTLPGRISVFGIPSLPPFHIQILSALSHRTEVNLFLLNPSREYWFQIVSPKEKGRQLSRHPEQPGLFDLLETGNPLLSSMGVQGRDFFELLYSESPLDDGATGLFAEPEKEGMLHEIQRDILGMTDGTTGNRTPFAIQDDDISLEIHSCHTPLRELEVLHDRMLKLFEAIPGLAPRDILVMIPRLDEYAPFIAAVFGSCRDDERKIPFAIADRTLAVSGSLAKGFVDLLDIAESRFEASRIMDLLEKPVVAKRFGINDDAIPVVLRWISGSGIRWGIDAADRHEEGLPIFAENSWSAGLDRLLLGYALPGDGSSLFAGILPYPDIEGAGAVNLGGVMQFANALFALRRSRMQERTLPEWSRYLNTLLDTFFLPDDEVQPEHALLAATFDDLRKRGEAAGFKGRIALPVIRSWLLGRLSKASAAEGFLTGRVTFCAMLPMRSIPFRVIALLGMNDGVFPRQHHPPGFDLMAAAPRRCDRSIRNEDRYLFLESLLSARDSLYISYTGQSSRDNSVLPPSVLVSELLDYAETAFAVHGFSDSSRRRESVRERIVVRHRLQPFHRDYFNQSDPKLFSYSRENCLAAGALRAGGGKSAILEGLPLPPLSAEHHQVTIDQLASFLRNPANSFLNRLGIRIDRIKPPVDDREPFVTDGLAAYTLCGEMVDEFLAGNDPAEQQDIFLARGVLPPAGQGKVACAGIRGKAERFAAAVAPFAGLPSLEPVEIDETVTGCRITGRINGITSAGILRYRSAALKSSDLLGCWVQHLVLNCAAPAGYPLQSTLIAIDGRWKFTPCSTAGEHLAQLVALYLDAMREPIPFFPETSYAFAMNPEKPEKLNSPWNGFRKVTTVQPGERQRELSFELFFGSLTAEELFALPGFRQHAQAVYAPLLQSLAKDDN